MKLLQVPKKRIGGKFVLLVMITLIAGLWACTEDLLLEPKQYGTIKGQALLKDTRQPVANALVRLKPGGQSVDTDSTGNFSFTSLAEGTYTVTISQTSYRTETVSVEVVKGEAATIRFLLEIDQFLNLPPTRPTLVSPAQAGTVNTVSRSVKLKWQAKDPNRDTLTYDLYFFREGETPLLPYLSNIRADSAIIEDLNFNTTYYWQVVAKDKSTSTFGEVWNFRKGPLPDLSYVFVRQVNNQLQIFTAETENEDLQLTTAGSNWRPVVSPNRQTIAYISNVGGEMHLYVMDRDGFNKRKVTTLPISGASAADLSFCWSPDGTELLYPHNDKLFAVRQDGTGLRQVAQADNNRFFSGCDWNEKRNLIIGRTTSGNVYDYEFLIFNANGNLQRRLKPGPGRTSNPVFSIPGDHILYSRDISGFENVQGRQLDARLFYYDLSSDFAMDFSTGKVGGTNDLEPRFGPTGYNIIFMNVDNDGFSERKIITVDITKEIRDFNRRKIISNATMPYWR
jgi:TolB protein